MGSYFDPFGTSVKNRTSQQNSKYILLVQFYALNGGSSYLIQQLATKKHSFSKQIDWNKSIAEPTLKELP